MTMVNQRGEEIVEETLMFGNDFRDAYEIGEAITLLAHHLGMKLVRTNATKHGDTQITLVKDE